MNLFCIEELRFPGAGVMGFHSRGEVCIFEQVSISGCI